MADHINSLLPDNLKSRISRIYVRKNSFTADDGKKVEYERLVLQLLIKGEICDIEIKPEKKDILLLSLADVVDKPDFQQEPIR